MCRQYQFQFAECGHVETSGHWKFRCDHPGSSRGETVVIQQPQHCFRCLQQDQMPERQMNVYLVRPNLSEAARKFEQILSHHEHHPTGNPQHFDKADIRALGSLDGRLSEDDRLWLQELETRLDAALWAEKEQVRGHGSLKDKRILVLQLRFARLTAFVYTKEAVKRCGERLEKAKHDIRIRKTSRIMSLLSAIKIHELGQGDSDCSICYHRLEDEAHADFMHSPYRLPCGHIFCFDCVTTWLANEPGTCPACRADFNLSNDFTRDYIAIMSSVVNATNHDMANPSSPWWMDMLRAE